ncbi:hypothetical protein BJX96DRAFT_171228 [Aspergillus floccosus]
MAAGIAVLIGPFLPIVISGLYTVTDVVSTSNITLTQMNRVNMSEGYFYHQTSDFEDVKLGDMIIQYNLSYPQWTYQDLSLPKLQVNQTSLPNETASALNSSGYSVEAQVPGLRLNLGCEELPPNAYTAGPDPDIYGEVHIGANVTTLIEDCAFEAGYLRSAGISSENRYFNGFDTSRARDLSQLPTITLLECKPKIEQMDVSIRLSLPSYTFDRSYPPSVVPNSVTTLFDGYMGSPGNLPPLTATKSHMPSWKYIPEIVPRKVSTQDRPVYTASLENPFRARLFQNMISTRILQAILAAMALCGSISIFLMDTREVLPKNPLSIAAAASLLADSSILGSGTTASHERSMGMIPPGSEWCNDQQLKQRGVFQGRTFTLGWWETEESDDYTNNLVFR